MENKIDLGKVALALLAFALLYLVTAFVMSSATTLSSKTYRLKESIGPIRTTVDNTVLEVNVQGRLMNNSWSYLELVMQNSKKEYLYSFGKELWRESGYDSDGSWSEADQDFTQKITIPKKGIYYLALTGEGSNNNSTYKVRVSEAAGSSLPHMWIGILLILVGLVLNEIKNRTLISVASALSQGPLFLNHLLVHF